MSKHWGRPCSNCATAACIVPDPGRLISGRRTKKNRTLVECGIKFGDLPAGPRKDAGRRYITHIHSNFGIVLAQAAFLALSSKNCSSSVEPCRAVVDDWPCWMAWVTASK